MWEWFCKFWLEVLFGAVLAGIGVVQRRLSKRMKDEKARNQAIENGVRDMLRLTILDNYERCKWAGSISVARKDAVDSAYQS